MTEPIHTSFLLSSERSGSNLALRLIGAHPQVCAPTPTHLFPVLTQELFRYGDLTQPRAWSQLLEDTVALHAARYGSWKHVPSVDGLARAIDRPSLGAILREIYGAEARAHGKPRLFIKAHQAASYGAFLQAEFPDAKYVHLVRDPRDMALSWKQTAGLRGGVVRAAGLWRDDQQGLLRLTGQLGLGERVRVVRYEALISDPSGVLEELCGFLGIAYRPEMLDFHRDATTRDNARRIAAWSNLGRPVDRENAGRFRDLLSRDEILYVESLCEELMVSFGYEPECRVGERDFAALEKELLAGEPWEKPEYAALPESERRAHARLRHATEAIRRRPPAARVTRTGARSR